MFISVFVLENGGVPLNPFMVFDYFLLDAVDRDLICEGNNNLVKHCNEIWVFGVGSNGGTCRNSNCQNVPDRRCSLKHLPTLKISTRKEKSL